MIKMKEKMSVLLVAALLCSLLTGAIAEDTVLIIQDMKRTTAFSEDAVLQEDLDQILEAGVSTVYQLDSQPWQFVAITSTSILDLIADEAASASPVAEGGSEPEKAPEEDAEEIPDEGSGEVPDEFPEEGRGAEDHLSDEPAVNEAPAAIVIYADDGGRSYSAEFDCGAAAQNMMHAANAMGYDTSVITAPLRALNGDSHDDWCLQLGVGTEMKAVAVILIGTAAETSPQEYDINELMTENVSYVQ